MSSHVFECWGGQVKKIEEGDIEALIDKNLLIGFFLPFCRIGLGLIFWAEAKKGYSFEQLCDLAKKKYPTDDDLTVRKHVERALDILLDIGLFSAKWEKKNGRWVRLFYNRNEIARRLHPYQDYMQSSSDSISSLLLVNLLLWGPYKNPFFFSEILKINAYLAHIGDIIDPDHWHINVECNPPVYFSDIWSVLKDISKNHLYDANIKFYHERKKISIYGLEEWIEGEVEELKDQGKIKLTQAKIRLLLEPEDIPQKRNSDYDFNVRYLLVVPIVNFELKVIDGKNDEKKIKEIYSILSKKLVASFFKVFSEQLKKIEPDISFALNADCKLLQYELENYKLFQEDFRKILNNKWNPQLTMDLSHKLWDSFVPKNLQARINDIEEDLKDCIVNSIEKCKLPNDRDGNVLVTLARKGDVLVKHLCRIYQEEVETYLNDKFGQLGSGIDERSFHTLSETEFFLKVKNAKIDNISNLVIFDDAIDEGRKLEAVIKRLKKEKVKVENIYIITYALNKLNEQSINESLVFNGKKISLFYHKAV